MIAITHDFQVNKTKSQSTYRKCAILKTQKLIAKIVEHKFVK
jgi:hypothetical protein